MDKPTAPNEFQFLSFTEQMQQQFGALQIELARLAAVAPERRPSAESVEQSWPPEHMARLARLQAAAAAIRLAAGLLEIDDRAAAAPLMATLADLTGQVKEWRRSGQGWFEDRLIKRPRLRWGKNDEGKIYLVGVDYVWYGPYRYFRWRQEGKLKTHYLGRVDQLEAAEAQAGSSYDGSIDPAMEAD